MKINKIVLYNFNSYEGLNEFDFSTTDKEKNIVLIGGKNGAGKTSLFTAIKIALYGPLAFGYVGTNPHYISKIKDCININAFQQNHVESRVQIDISLLVEREIKEYQITREWDYTNQKLEEKYYVKLENKLLDEQKLSYFENYLQSLIPPDLFEFFLFDGEEVGSVFSTSSYNNYVKNAIYTLCGLDVFEFVRKYSTGYAGKAKTEDEEIVYKNYESLKIRLEELYEKKSNLEVAFTENQTELDEVDTALIELETAFKNAGGIIETERAQLSKEYEISERVKAETSAQIKMFVEGLMPFFILRGFSERVKKQLEIEEKGEIYTYIKQSVNKKELIQDLGEIIPEETLDRVMEVFLRKFKPDDDSSTSPIYQLSKEEAYRVNSVITSANDFDVEEMIRLINERKYASERTMEINRILKSSMGDEESRKFEEKENILLKKKDDLSANIYRIQTEISKLIDQINNYELERDRLKQRIKDTVQNKNVFKLSDGLSRMMSTLLQNKSYAIQRALESTIVENLQRIYRKNNLITHIEITDQFDFNLYQDATYSKEEIEYLLKNLGKQAFSNEIGIQGLKILYDSLGIDNLNELQASLLYENADKEMKLYKRIDISRLSKGERQIFILSFYWAIIKISGQEIPFIIDTPYARIDANHRKEISEKFFPNISKQVVILSTDEEINEEYYQILKPHIAKEYLLINDEGQNRTTVEQRYFYEV